jgi:nitroreductase
VIDQLVRENRSCRRFQEDTPVAPEVLRDLVTLARYCPSGANKQPLKFHLACDPEANAEIFPCLGWAAYLADWKGPAEGERPTAYITILGDTEISKNFDCDLGITAQTIMLGARAIGLGGCMIATINRDRLARYLRLPDHLKLLLVLALGTPKETIVVETVGADGNIRYWRDAQGVHHVPKRPLSELIYDA